jgi:hypothetical protein
MRLLLALDLINIDYKDKGGKAFFLEGLFVKKIGQ